MATILVVDDRSINRDFLATLLTYAGHRVLQASDGRQACGIAEEEIPDLIITDILMPTMDGMELARKLAGQSSTADIPIVFYTATYRVKEARAFAESCGARAVLTKPAEPGEILDVVASILGRPGEIQGSGPVPALPDDVVLRPAPHAGDLMQLQKRLSRVLEAEYEHVERAVPAAGTDRARTFTALQTLSLRLAALVELGVDLASESDPQRLIEQFCRMSQNIIGARRSLVVILDSQLQRVTHAAARGLSASRQDILRLDVRGSIALQAMEQMKPVRVHPPARNDRVSALHEPANAAIAVPLRSTHIRGFLYLGDRVGADSFLDEDEEFATTLATQFSLAFGNLILQTEARARAEQLELEIGERQRAVDELRESQEKLRQLADNMNEAFFILDAAKRRLLYVSPAYERIWGRSCAEALTGDPAWTENILPADHVRMRSSRSGESDISPFDDEFRIVRPDGSQRWVRARGNPIFSESGELKYFCGIAEDVTERKLHEERIARLTRTHAMMSSINSAIIRIRERRELLTEACRVAVKEGAFRLAWTCEVKPDGTLGEVSACTGGDCSISADGRLAMPDGAVAERWPAARAAREGRIIVCNDISREASLETMRREFVDRGHRSMIALPIMVDGSACAVIVLTADAVDFFGDDEVKLLAELTSDLSFGSEYIEKEERLTYLAFYDPLTGLPNSTLYMDRLTRLIEAARGTRGMVAVAVVDIDRFTQLNDNLGRHVGDQLLRKVAERLKALAVGQSTLTRIGGDSFALAIESTQRGSAAAAAAQSSIMNAFAEPIVLGEAVLRISVKAGIALFPGDGDDAATVFKNAEAALKRAQAANHRCLYYAPEFNARVDERLSLEATLRAAVESKSFLLHYQPKIDCRSLRVVGLEALLRLPSREGFTRGPAEFVPVLEETGWIAEVGVWVIKAGLEQYQAWQKMKLSPPRIAVNVSPVQMRQVDFAERVLAAVAETGAPPDALELEITEGVIMENIEATRRVLRKLTGVGVSIAIDDFGTGHSTLSYLARLPVQSLKVDKSFILRMLTDSDSMTIVSSIISLAHALNLKVVAEGVESIEQSKILKLMKCDELQGFLFGEPMPADKFEELLRQKRTDADPK